MRRRLLLGFLLGFFLVGGLLVLLSTLPAPRGIEPAAYRPSRPSPLEGALAPNRALEAVELLGEGWLDGPEDVEPVGDGTLLAGTADGSIRHLVPTADGYRGELFARTGGRPLGLDRDPTGTLWVADSERGLVAIGSEGEVAAVVDEVAGLPVAFADDVDTGPDGRVFFSDASRRHDAEALFLETLEARPWGRLIEHEPGSGESRVLLDGLYFANGVAVAADGRFVLVAETFRYRVSRHWLSGPRAGETEIFVDYLPGFPDGISSDGRGGFWLAIYSLRSRLLDRFLHPRPRLKRLVARLPAALRPPPRPYGLVLALDGDGRIVSSLHDPEGERYPFVTSVEEHAGRLYLGSVEGRAIGRYALD